MPLRANAQRAVPQRTNAQRAVPQRANATTGCAAKKSLLEPVEVA